VGLRVLLRVNHISLILFLSLITLLNYLIIISFIVFPVLIFDLFCFDFLFLGESFVGFAEVVEALILMLIIGVHEAVLLVNHVLLAPPCIFEHVTAEETEISEVDSLGHVGEESLEVDYAVQV
jgi:hypothetical protein